MWVEPGQWKKGLNSRKKSQLYSRYKNILNFQRSRFACIFSDLGFLFDITPKVVMGSCWNYVCGYGLAIERSDDILGKIWIIL